MSSLAILRLASAGALACGVLGIVLGFFTKKFQLHGWLALLLLALSVVVFVSIEPADQEKTGRLPLMFLFATLTPCVVVYSWFAFKGAKNRPAALAALVGGIIMGMLFIFFMVGAAYALLQTFIVKLQ